MSNEYAKAGSELLEDYARASRKSDTDAVAGSRASEAFVICKAEEIQNVFHEREEVLAYWRNNESLHETVSLQFDDGNARRPGDDLLLADAHMRRDIRFADDARQADGSPFAQRGQAMGGDNDIVVLIRQRDDEARLVGWIETPDAAITYLRSLCLSSADARQV